VRRRAEGEPVRVTVLCPRADNGGWVVDEEEARASSRGRLDQTLEALRSAGIEANGEVVASDPYEAVLDQLELDPPTEIIISTLPRTRSGWLRRDLVERVREGTKLPVEHVVVNPDASETTPS